LVFNFRKVILKINKIVLLKIFLLISKYNFKYYFIYIPFFNLKVNIFNLIDFLYFSNYPANTGKPIVAVLINAPAKIIKGSKG